jgi:hypothetical protein
LRLFLPNPREELSIHMAEADVISNQQQILANQKQILANQQEIKDNQSMIKQNQDKLDTILKNQQEILSLLKK